ncbi:MAG: aminotransferase class V-fold PLP-dependent enzyme [Rhodospirillaceae bacterium]|nr:aminotransferase class V-fold PLP-dependent enzyme [Rhodospirillaceae bacterium]
MTASLIPKQDFVGIEAVAHLAAGGEAPPLRAHMDAAVQFLCDKGAGMPGRERMYALAGRVKRRLAELLGRSPAEIGFLFNASEGLFVAAGGIDWRSGDNVVTAGSEFPSVRHAWHHGHPVEVRAVGGTLVPSLAEIRAAVDGRTRVIAVSHVSYLTGARCDLAALREIADGVGARLVVDASHALGVVPVDGALCDVVVSCCYKWMLGAHGVGVFFVNAERWPDLAAPWMGWHSIEPEPSPRADRLQPKASMERFESGNYGFPGLYLLEAGLAALARVGAPAIERHVLALGGRLREELVRCGAEVLTPAAPADRAGNIAIAHGGSERLEAALRAAGVLTWAGNGRLRLSVHAYNDEADVARAAAALAALLR